MTKRRTWISSRCLTSIRCNKELKFNTISRLPTSSLNAWTRATRELPLNPLLLLRRKSRRVEFDLPRQRSQDRREDSFSTSSPRERCRGIRRSTRFLTLISSQRIPRVEKPSVWLNSRLSATQTSFLVAPQSQVCASKKSDPNPLPEIKCNPLKSSRALQTSLTKKQNKT